MGFQQVERAQEVLDLHARIANLHRAARFTLPANDR